MVKPVFNYPMRKFIYNISYFCYNKHIFDLSAVKSIEEVRLEYKKEKYKEYVFYFVNVKYF